jgi:DNA-binding SARP family transcriptional activator
VVRRSLRRAVLDPASMSGPAQPAPEGRITGDRDQAVLDGGQAKTLHGDKQRIVLAVLALASGQVVPVSRLVDAVWADSPPATAHRQILNTVSGLRKVLGPAVMTKPAGYRLDPARTRTDVDVFEATRAAAGQAAAQGRFRRAAELLGTALDLWRGPALGGATGLASEATRLEERRLAVVEERTQLDLACGAHQELVAELSALVAAHPLRERLRAQLMLALYRCGRHADALASFHAARRMIIDELGLEPGPELRRLQRAILAGDPALDLADQPTPAEHATDNTQVPVVAHQADWDVPAQLPADVAAFTGRQAHLHQLTTLITAEPGAEISANAMVIAAITGTAGVGKDSARRALGAPGAGPIPRRAAVRRPRGSPAGHRLPYPCAHPLPAHRAAGPGGRRAGQPGVGAAATGAATSCRGRPDRGAATTRTDRLARRRCHRTGQPRGPGAPARSAGRKRRPGSPERWTCTTSSAAGTARPRHCMA